MAHQARVSLVIHPPALPPLPSIRQLNLQELLEQHLLLVVELWRRWLDLLALPVPHLLLRRGVNVYVRVWFEGRGWLWFCFLVKCFFFVFSRLSSKLFLIRLLTYKLKNNLN